MAYIIQDACKKYVSHTKCKNPSAIPPEDMGFPKRNLEIELTEDIEQALVFTDFNHAEWVREHISFPTSIVSLPG